MGYRLISTAPTVVFVVQVRQRHRLGTVVTPYHIREAADHLGLGMEDVRECVQELGGTVWDDGDDQVNKVLKQLLLVAGVGSHVHSILLRLAPFGRSRRGCGGTLRWTSQKRYVVFACRLPLHAAIIPLAAVSPLWWTPYCRCMLCSLPDPAVDSPCAERQHRRASSLGSNAPQIPLSVCRLISVPITFSPVYRQ